MKLNRFVCEMCGLPLKLPRGFRFSPTDEGLIDYLRSKISGDDEDQVDFIPEIPFYKWEPWELPGKSSIPTMDSQLFFITQPELKHRKGNRLNRKTKAGFWKPTGNDRKIMSGSSLIGMKRTLVFYEVRARKCTKTSWVTHEYRTEPYQNSFLLYRVFDKRKGRNGAGPSVQSPTTSKSHLDGTNSEIALGFESPSSDVQVPDFGTRTINDGFHAENSDAAISDATTAVENQSAQDTFAEDEQLRLSEEDFEFLAACMQEPVDATELKEGMNLEKVSPAFLEVSPVTNDVNSSHGGVGLQNGMNENAAYSYGDFISLDDLDDDFRNQSGGQKNLASGFETPMNTATGQLAEVTATELKEDMNLEKVSPAFLEVSPVTNDVNSSHGGVGLQNGMNENAAYSDGDFISLDDLDDDFRNQSGGQKNLASGFETPMNTATDQLAEVTATELKEGMNLEKVSPAFPAVSPVTNDVNSSHDGVGLQNGMNENDNFHNESGGQNDLASGSETPMNIVCSEDNGSCRGSNAEHGQVPWQYRENYPAAYSPECWELIFHNPYYVFPPIEPLGGSSNQILRSD